jgi:hypothetical protein
MFKDHRLGDEGEFLVILWLAPIQTLGDGIEVRNVGVKIVIYSDNEVSDEIVLNSIKKANLISENMAGLSRAVEVELGTPMFKNRALQIYKRLREVEKRVRNHGVAGKQLENALDKLSSKKLSFKQLNEFCHQLTKDFPELFLPLGKDFDDEKKAWELASLCEMRVLINQ